MGEPNGQHVKRVRLISECVRHDRDHEDGPLLVLHDRFRVGHHDRQVRPDEGEFLIVPRGVEHRPVAVEEPHVLPFEPAGTLNTGTTG